MSYPGAVLNPPSFGGGLGFAELGSDGTVGGPGGSPVSPILTGALSITNPAYGAKGDGKILTDGAITATQGALSSATPFTAADIGKLVVVYGAGQTANTGASIGGALTTTIASIGVGGVANLNANAITTVAGATVYYGTDNTAAIQAAIAAASALSTLSGGGGTVLVPSGGIFMVRQLTPASNVTIFGLGGALVWANASAGEAVISNRTSPSAFANFSVIGVQFIGPGTQGVEGTCNAFDLTLGTNVRVISCNIQQFPSSAIAIQDSSAIWIEDNYIQHCCLALAGHNAIQVVPLSGQTADTAFCIIRGNIIGSPTSPIPPACINCGGAFGSQTNPLHLTIDDNICFSATFSCITIEMGGTDVSDNAHVIKIQNNDVTQSYGGGSGAYGISAVIDSIPQPTTGTEVQDLIIANNIISSTSGGIQCQASRASITGNVISNCNGNGVFAQGVSSTYPISPLLIANNLIHSPINPVTPLLSIANTNNTSIVGNRVEFDTGSTGTGQPGIYIHNCGFVDVMANVVEYAAGHGIRFDTCNDFTAIGNRIRNPSDSGGNSHGIIISAATSTNSALNVIKGNVIQDDRAVALMWSGIANASSTCELTNNTIFGWTNSPIYSSTPKYSYNNVYPANLSHSTITPSASPFTYTNSGGPAVVTVTGGTLTGDTTIRGVDTGITHGAFYLGPDDTLTVTYSSAPTMILIPQK